MTKFSRVKTPFITLEEQGSDPATPDAGTHRFYVGTDGLLYLIDEADVVTPVGGLATDLDIGALAPETPTSGDLLVIERAGVRYSADVDDLPGGGGGGSLVFLESHIASASATLDFVLVDDTYNDYLLKISGLVPAASGNNLIMRFANDITPTWDSGNNYRWFRKYMNWAGAEGVVADGGLTSNIQIAAVIATTAGYSVNAHIRLSNLRTAALYKTINSTLEQRISSDSNFYSINTVGLWVDNTNKAFGVRLLMSSGNIASGAAYLYGIKDS